MNVSKRIKIGFITKTDPMDRRSSWAGTSYFMAKALREHVGDVCYLGPFNLMSDFIFKLTNKASLLIFNKRYEYRHSVVRAKLLAKLIKKEIDKQSLDLIFAPMASSEIAFLSTNIPIVYTSDATFHLLIDYYNNYTNLLTLSRREGEEIEELAIRNSALIFYPTEWAARSAVNVYGADNSKISVVPFGANYEDVPTCEIIFGRRKSESCRLLFLGADWERKGGDIAYRTLLKMNAAGVKTRLVVCGCTPPKGTSDSNLTVIPSLDKNDENQLRELGELFLNSDFLLLPTRAEAYGIAFCEASAFGLPTITTATGGVSGIVRNGENGFALPLDANDDCYAKTIIDIYQNEDVYLELRKSARATYDRILNWNSWGTSVGKKLKVILNK